MVLVVEGSEKHPVPVYLVLMQENKGGAFDRMKGDDPNWWLGLEAGIRVVVPSITKNIFCAGPYDCWYGALH